MTHTGSADILNLGTRPPFRVTASIHAHRTFCLVTLNWTGRSIRLAPSSCLTLPCAEEQVADPDFEALIERFLNRMGIGHIVIRRGVYTGPRRASPLALKVESILEFLPGVTTSRVHSNTVTGWLNRRPWLLPLPQAELAARERKVQARGIDTAAFAVSRVLRERASQVPPVSMPTEALADLRRLASGQIEVEG